MVTPQRARESSRRVAKARLIDDENRGLGIPWRKERAPGVLGPARRGKIAVHIAGLDADPIHGGEVADGITRVAVQHEFWFGRSARGEIELQGIAGSRLSVRLEFRRRVVSALIFMPARNTPDRDACAASASRLHLGGNFRGANHVAYPPARDAVGEIIRGEQRRGGNDDAAQLHDRQHRFPEGRNVAQHQQDAVAAVHAQLAEVVRNAGRALRQLGKRQLGFFSAFVHHPQGGLVAPVAGGDAVKPVQRPIEAIELGPLEARVSGLIIVAVREQKIARGAEGLRRRIVQFTHCCFAAARG